MLLDELEKFNIDIVGISETHWCSDVDVVFQQNRYMIIQSGREDGIQRQSVALNLSSEYVNGLLSYEAVSLRMVSVRVKTRTVCDTSSTYMHQTHLTLMNNTKTSWIC